MKKPDNTGKAIAKSLHTVTVLYQVARVFHDAGSNTGTLEAALDDALDALELAGRPDPYALRARALGLLLADQPKDA